MKSTKKILLVMALILGLGLIIYFGFIQNQFLEESVGYSTVNFDGNNLIYSGVVGPDYNWWKQNHVFRQWTGGNVIDFSFYKNTGFLNFYLLANGVNPNDFSNLPGNGDCLPYNDVLKVNYCKVPTEPNVEKTYVDADGCQHYKILSSTKTLDCLCSNNPYVNKVCGADVKSWTCYQCGPCAYGALGCRIWDCSVYSSTVINEDFGGTIDGIARGYKAKLESAGFTLTQKDYISQGKPGELRCTEFSYIFVWSGTPSSNGLKAITDNYICEVSGTSTQCANNVDCTGSNSYKLLGKVEWSDIQSGLVCRVNGGITGNRISEGTVTFMKPIEITVYNLDVATKTCNPVTKNQRDVTTGDYLTQSQCESTITYTQEEYTAQQELLRSLNMSYAERAALIQSLNLSLQEQINLIKDLNLKVEENVLLIESLNLNIQQQADIINSLTSNLAEKAYYVSQLQAENENQARLIAEMKESFANQGTIIANLGLTIQEDAQLINNLNLTVQQEAEIIKGLTTNLEEQAAIVNDLKLTNDEQATIIASLTSNIQDQQNLVASLNISQTEREQLLNSLQSENSKLKAQQTTMLLVIIGSVVIIVGLIVYIFFRKK